MPRARSQVEAIIDQLATIRAHIQSLNQTLANQVCPFYKLEPATACLIIFQGSSNAPLSPKSQANAEERRIQDLQAHIAQLKKRVRVLLAYHYLLLTP
jgi:hypothetical protein